VTVSRTDKKKPARPARNRTGLSIESILEGSPIPTFVIDRNHKIILWNKACAELTGYHARNMIGTGNHHKPLYPEKRPLIADLIVDQDMEALERYYGAKQVQKSSVIEGAYEATDFFENLGGKPRYLYFLAAPVYDDDGEVIAAIETLQDVTRERELARHLRENAETLRRELDENIRLRKTIEGIIEGSPIPTFVIDRSHRILLWNRAFTEMSGFEGHRMIGTKKQWMPFYPEKRPVIADLIVDGDAKGLEAFYGKKKVQKSSVIEGAYEASDFYENIGGRSRHLYFLAAPIRNEKGEIIAAVETLQDVTRERELERSLKEQAETLKRELEANIRLRKTIEGISEGSPIPTFVIDRNHRIILWNRAFTEMSGFPGETMIGTDNQWMPFYPEKRPVIADLIMDGDLGGLERFYGKKKVQKSSVIEGAYEATDFYENLGGKRRHLYFLAAPILDEKGEVIAAIETLQDVTREREMELSLKEYAETMKNELEENICLRKNMEELFNFHQSVLDASPDLILVLDSDGTLRYMSRDIDPEGGLTAGNLKGRHFSEFVAPQRREFLEERWAEIRRGVFTPFEIEGAEKDGSKRNLLLTARPIKGTDRFLVLQRDITEFKELENRYYESQKLAAVGQLSAGIAHEVRNPLSSIKMSLQILEKRMNPEGNDLKRFHIARKEVEHLEKLVSDILVFARPTEPDAHPADLNMCVESSLAMAERGVEEKSIRVQTRFDDRIPPVSFDAAMLQQAFLNIYLNAVDAMAEGGTLAIRTRLEEAKGEAIVEIEDNGNGIDEESLAHVFNPFFTTKKYGTGLGLSQVKKIIDQHRGSIEILSRRGEGTCVVIALPLHRA
jgi:PAS domain S-box-containing protein